MKMKRDGLAAFHGTIFAWMKYCDTSNKQYEQLHNMADWDYVLETHL
jgi:hypothetical protein